MSIFNGIFNSRAVKNESNINWIDLNNSDQLETINNISFSKPVIIFKHSTRCIISKMALKEFENEFNFNDKVDTYFLDLIEHKLISNQIAMTFKVIHQSPQLLLIKNGKIVYHDSHEGIKAEKLAQFI